MRFLHHFFGITDLKCSRALTRSIRQLLDMCSGLWVSKFTKFNDFEKLHCHTNISLSSLHFCMKIHSKIFNNGSKRFPEAHQTKWVFIKHFLFLFRSSKVKDAGLQNRIVTFFYNFWHHLNDIYRSRRAFVCLLMCVIDRNAVNGPNIMLPFTDTHEDDFNPKIYAPNMAAPQTGAYLALCRK